MNELTSSLPTAWDYQEGLLDLLDQGCSFVEIEEKVQKGTLGMPPATRNGLNGPKLESLIRWLQGFRKEAVLYQDKKVYLPLIELWAPPGGKAQFTYEVSAETSKTAEFTLFGVTALGGGSKRKFTESIKMACDGEGRSFNLGILLTVTRYVHKDDKSKQIEKVDVKGMQEGFDCMIQDLSADRFILKSREIREIELLDDEYSNFRFLRLSDSRQKGTDTYAPATEESTDWSFQLSLPLLQEKIKIGISAKHSRALNASFDCPAGADYVFFSRFGENPAVPFCAKLLI